MTLNDLGVQLFETFVNPLSWKCSVWLLLRDYQRVYFVTKMKDHWRSRLVIHMRYTSANISATVRDSDIVTMDN